MFMWIRNSLIILPLVLIVFLLSSWAWVPSSAEISADESRQDRLIVSLPNDINSLNPWFSNSAYDSDVYSWIVEGLASANGNFVPEPCLAETLKVGEDVIVVLSPSDDPAAMRAALEAKMRESFPETFKGIREYVHRDFVGGEGKFAYWKYGPKSEGEVGDRPAVPSAYAKGIPSESGDSPTATGRARDLAVRFVLTFRAGAPKNESHIPSAVVTDIGERIDAVVEEAGLGAKWVSGFDRWKEATVWYQHLTGASVPLELPSAPESPAANGKVDEAAEKIFKESQEKFNKDLEAAKLAYGQKLTDAVKAMHGQDAPSFEGYLKDFAQGRIAEHPVIEVKLREGVKWHDFDESGRTLDAEDVLFTYEFALDKDVNTDSKSYVDTMLQMRMHGSHSFDIVYKKLYSPALFHLTYAKILPRHKFSPEEWLRQAKAKGRGPAYEGDPSYNVRKALPAQELEYSMNPVGTGPYKIFPLNGESLPTWRSGELVRLQRNDDYWNELDMSAFKYFDFYIIDPDLGEETAEINFRSGGLDLFAIKPHQVEKYEALRDKYYVYKRPNLTYSYFGFNLENPILKDLRVRQALTMAVDVDAMIQAVLYGQGRRVSGPAYPILPYYDETYVPDYTFRQGPHKGKTLKEAGMKYLPHDLKEAEALLREVGWTKNAGGKLNKDGVPLKFELSYSGISTSPTAKICALATEKWKELGVEVKDSQQDFNVFIAERVMARKYDVLNLGWNGGIDFDKRKLWASDQLPPKGYNFTAFNDPRADKLFDTMLKEYDTERVIKMSHEAFRIIADAQPYLFLFTSYTNLAVDRHIYWAPPVIGPDGKVKRDANGDIVREERSFVDDGQMNWAYGPRTQRVQHKRGAKIKFPANENERAVVAEPTRVKDLKPSAKSK